VFQNQDHKLVRSKRSSQHQPRLRSRGVGIHCAQRLHLLRADDADAALPKPLTSSPDRLGGKVEPAATSGLLAIHEGSGEVLVIVKEGFTSRPCRSPTDITEVSAKLLLAFGRDRSR